MQFVIAWLIITLQNIYSLLLVVSWDILVDTPMREQFFFYYWISYLRSKIVCCVIRFFLFEIYFNCAIDTRSTRFVVGLLDDCYWWSFFPDIDQHEIFISCTSQICLLKRWQTKTNSEIVSETFVLILHASIRETRKFVCFINQSIYGH